LVLAETTKTSFDIAAPTDGFVWQVAEAGADVVVGTVLCYIAPDSQRAEAAACAASGRAREPRVDVLPRVVSVAEQRSRPPRFSAKAMALVRQTGLDPAVFNGRDLVREQDVRAFRDNGKPRIVANAPSVADRSTITRPIDGFTPSRGVPTRAEILPRSKRFEGRHLRAALSNTIPSAVTLAVPTSGAFAAAAEKPETAGVRSAAIIAETARLLRGYPMFNAHFGNDQIHYYEEVNIGFAVDLGNGLKVPVLRGADQKTMRQLADEKERLLVDYLEDSLAPESLMGATFTVTDLSGEGATHFQPVINDGQSAILGVCADTFPRPGAQGVFNLILAFDHQLADGRTASRFLRDLSDRLVAHEASLAAASAAVTPELECCLCLRSVGELEQDRHFLVRTVTAGANPERIVCTVCLEDWYA
jgi:pyruvate/2-oxoglutarate dehydrogenase complex dihydrolipoamide acyltransferase (E2) component